jgi:hypothetical protein
MGYGPLVLFLASGQRHVLGHVQASMQDYALMEHYRFTAA